jgi:hypothetical protein
LSPSLSSNVGVSRSVAGPLSVENCIRDAGFVVQTQLCYEGFMTLDDCMFFSGSLDVDCSSSLDDFFSAYDMDASACIEAPWKLRC